MVKIRLFSEDSGRCHCPKAVPQFLIKDSYVKILWCSKATAQCRDTVTYWPGWVNQVCGSQKASSISNVMN